MAIAQNGPGSNHRGRLGNVVYYMLKGKNVSREVGVSTKPATDAQLRSRQITRLSSGIISRLLDFINVGFSTLALEANDNTFNQAVKYNKKNIIKGDYPDLEIAYDQLLVSKGPLKQAQNWQVTPVAAGLQYSWDTDPEMPWPEVTDQVMMLAYFPGQEKVFFNLFGNSRLVGNDLLEIPSNLLGEYMETYMSFVASDRKQVADSTYTGKFNLGSPENLILIS